ENVGYGLRMRGVHATVCRGVVAHHLEKVGLTQFAKAYPYQLSGGMKQRASVARAFATAPQILLMDEPFAAVDEQTRALLQEELLRVWESDRKTVVYITHSIDEALVLGDASPILLLALWEGAGRVGVLDARFFPAPSAIAGTFVDLMRSGELVEHTWTSLGRILIGFTLGAVPGLVIGIAMGLSRLVRA